MASAIDDDTKQTVARGRATIGSLLTNARDDARKVFLVFVAGFLGTFYAFRVFIWDRVRQDLTPVTTSEVIARTPFDVILLQAKLGMAMGIIIAIPFVIYYGRDALRARGWWPAEDVPRWKLVFPGTLAAVLFVAGIGYAYFVFFPVMLGFLATNAANAGFQPSWSIVKLTEFILFLSLSFGIAAQLPLVMGSLSYLQVVTYEQFREKWRHAVVAIFVFGALFSPPDPITQIMWAVPLIGLYAFSLQLARFAQLVRRSTDEVDFAAVVDRHWNVLAGTAFVAFLAVYLFLTRGGIAAVNDARTALPEDYRPGSLPGLGEATGLDPAIAAGLVGAAVALVALPVVLFVYAVRALDAARDPTEPVGSPADIDLSKLDASAIKITPPERFEAMDEDEATDLARDALQDDDPEKAQAILDRYDEVQEQVEKREQAEADAEATDAEAAETEADAGGAEAPVPGAGGDDDDRSTTAGIVDAFTDEETTDEDIGGYYTDIAFILESVTSRAFRIVGLFGAVMAATFIYLYRGGIKDVKDAFLARMPESQTGQVDLVALHPVEALVFEIKVSTLLAAIVTLPLVLYYMWPRLRERGVVRGDQRVIATWGVSLVVAVIGGSILGFFVVAPAVISWLAQDVINANMVIYYRINNFGWLVIFTTIGIGLLAEIPVTMLLFHRGGLVTFSTMLERWRTVVMGIVVAAGVFTPSSLLTMLVFAIPTAIAYMIGLVVLWVYTLGGRRTPRRKSEAAD